VAKNGCGLGFEAGSELTRRRRDLISAVVGLPGWSLPNAGSVNQMRLGPRSERNSCSRSFGDQTRRFGGGVRLERALLWLLLVFFLSGCIIFHSCHSSRGSVGRAALSQICAFQTDSPASANWRPASSCIIICVPGTLTTCCGFWAVSCQATSDKKAFSYQSKYLRNY